MTNVILLVLYIFSSLKRVNKLFYSEYIFYHNWWHALLQNWNENLLQLL